MKILILKKKDCPYSQNALDFLRQTNHTIGSLDCEKRFDKFPKDLGWKPLYEFDKTIKETIIWYLENQDWVNYVKDESGYKGERLGVLN